MIHDGIQAGIQADKIFHARGQGMGLDLYLPLIIGVFPQRKRNDDIGHDLSQLLQDFMQGLGQKL